MTVVALVLGAGSGERYRESVGAGGRRGEAADTALPKAFLRLDGRSLLARSIAALQSCPEIDRIVPVLSRDGLPRWPAVAAELTSRSRVAEPVAGGRERQDSVRRGLATLGPEVELVAVHDAARPLVRSPAIGRVVRLARQHGAAILAAPVVDTVKRVVRGRVVGTPPRQECWAAQTPQVFRVEWLREALDKAAAEGFVGTDDAELVARLGVAVFVAVGDPGNLKITRAPDLELAAAWLREGGKGP